MMPTKKQLEDKLIKGRFLPITDDLFRLYAQYETLCADTHDTDGLLLLDFYKGEAFFRMGQYENAQIYLNRCLLQCTPETSRTIIADCYNILGLLQTAMGHEFFALENYFLALDAAIQAGNTYKKMVVQINIGWFYRELGDFEKALSYFFESLTNLSSMETPSFPYNVKILCYCYIGQIYFSTKRYQKGLEIKDIIDREIAASDSKIFYNVSVYNFYIRAYHYLQDTERFEKLADRILESARGTVDFLEFSENYLDICKYLLPIDKKRTRQLLDTLHHNIMHSALPYLKLKLQTLEALYQQRYADHQSYLEACSKYMIMQQTYDAVNRQSKLSSLDNLEALRKAQKDSQRYLEQSRRDLMTGLLNKVSFEQLISSTCQALSCKRNTLSALAVIDLDHFKDINDRFGHIQGDRVLLDTVQYMTEAFEDAAILGRIGGDEFGVFWPDAKSPEHIRQQIAALQEFYARHYPSPTSSCCPTVSVGVACVEHPCRSYQALFEKADSALYQAKKSGRNAMAII